MRPKSKRALYICGTVLAAILIIVMAVVLKNAAADKSYSVYFDRGSELYESPGLRQRTCVSAQGRV